MSPEVLAAREKLKPLPFSLTSSQIEAVNTILADHARLEKAAEEMAEQCKIVRNTLINHLEEPERRAFWAAVQALTLHEHSKAGDP